MALGGHITKTATGVVKANFSVNLYKESIGDPDLGTIVETQYRTLVGTSSSTQMSIGLTSSHQYSFAANSTKSLGTIVGTQPAIYCVFIIPKAIATNAVLSVLNESVTHYRNTAMIGFPIILCGINQTAINTSTQITATGGAISITVVCLYGQNFKGAATA